MNTTIGCSIPGASQPKEPALLIDASNVMETVFGAIELDDSQYLAIQHEIEKLSTIDHESLRPKEEWISVKDRLPKPQTEVLAFRRGIMYFAWYDNEIGKWSSDEWGLLDAVTHWMPLPEPPEVTP